MFQQEIHSGVLCWEDEKYLTDWRVKVKSKFRKIEDFNDEKFEQIDKSSLEPICIKFVREPNSKKKKKNPKYYR